MDIQQRCAFCGGDGGPPKPFRRLGDDTPLMKTIDDQLTCGPCYYSGKVRPLSDELRRARKSQP